MSNKTKLHETWQRYEASTKEYLLSLRDVRNVGSLVFLILMLLISWSGIKAIQTNYKLQQEVTQLQQEDQVAKLRNNNQKLENEYYTTPQYLEVTARQNFGLLAPGETELLVPQAVALAHTKPLPKDSSVASTAKHKPVWQQNFEDWIDFFFHRAQQ